MTARGEIMKKMLMSLFLLFLFSASSSAGQQDRASKTVCDEHIVRAAVIGGMSVTTDLFAEIVKMFEADTGYKVEIVAAGPRPGLSVAMQEGKVDLLTMHSGDITTNLVADGYAVNMRPWTRNQLIIIGPKSDPAGIAGFRDGSAALKRLAETQSNFIDFKGIGPRELGNSLWKKAHINPSGAWVLKDESRGDILRFAEKKKAYLIIGAIPVLTEKLGKHNLRIMVDEDPFMRRPYIVMEANPDRFPSTNAKGAQALSNYLLSPKIQSFLSGFGKDRNPSGKPFFFPVVIRPQAVE
jgi:tungstate transport system substrate-binding protein